MESLLNDCWSILKMLYIKYSPSQSNFYWHFLNNEGGTFTYIIEQFNQ